MSAATPAIAALERLGIGYTLHHYEIDAPDGVAQHRGERVAYGTAAADALGIDPARMYKTLLFDLEGGAEKLALAVVPSSGTAAPKAIAAACDAKRATLADAAAVGRATGYVIGGVSPIGSRRPILTLIDESARFHTTIFVSAGQRGLSLELAPADLEQASSGRFAPIS